MSVGSPVPEDSQMHLKHSEFVYCPISKFKIFKNVAVISFGFLIVFTSFQSLTNLQSSLHVKQAVGSGSLAIVYSFIIVSAIFLPNFVISRIGCKWTMSVGMSCFLLYTLANFYAVWTTMAPASVLVGLAAAPLWAAQCNYLTRMSVMHSKMTGTHTHTSIKRFFGIFSMFFRTSQIWGNLITSQFLDDHPANESHFEPVVKMGHCGIEYCPQVYRAEEKLDNDKIYSICGIFTVSAVVAITLVLVFVDQIEVEDRIHPQSGNVQHLLKATAKHVWDSKSQKLLIPVTLYSGMEQAFIAATFTRAYVTCPLGVGHVGYVMAIYGVVDAICSFSIGQFVQYVGHIPFFALGLIDHCGCNIALLLWGPDFNTLLFLFLIAGAWGLGDAVLQTQLSALYGYFFIENSQAAFANLSIWESIGFIVVYAYNDYICVRSKVYLCLGILSFGIVGYIIVEWLQKRQLIKIRCDQTTEIGLTQKKINNDEN